MQLLREKDPDNGLPLTMLTMIAFQEGMGIEDTDAPWREKTVYQMEDGFAAGK